MDMEIDKARREIIAGQIDRIRIRRSLADLDDLSMFDDELEALANSVR